jgi:hypothetical protein
MLLSYLRSILGFIHLSSVGIEFLRDLVESMYVFEQTDHILLNVESICKVAN